MSDVSDILTGVIDLKRLTASILDRIAVAASLTPSRNPYASARMSVGIVGATVSGTSVLISQATGTSTSDASGRPTEWYDGIYPTGSGSFKSSATSFALRKDWGAGNSKIIAGFKCYGVTGTPADFVGVAGNPLVTFTLYGSNDASNWTSLGSTTANNASVGGGSIVSKLTGITVTTAYRYHEVRITQSAGANTMYCDECQFYEYSSAYVQVVGSTTESMYFTDNGVQVGILDFTSVSSIAVAGISDGFIYIDAVNDMGQPINKETTVQSSMPVRFFEQNGRIKVIKPGQEQYANIKMMAEPTADIRNNDIAYINSGIMGITICSLTFVQGIYDFDGATHHIECDIQQP